MSDASLRSRRIRAALLVATLVLITRLPALWLSRGGLLFSVDELELVRSVVDRFIGVPSTTLAWPAPLLQMIGVAGVALAAVMVPVTSPNALADYLSRLYLDGSGLLNFLRSVTAVAMACVFSLYFTRLRDAGRGELFSLGATLVFATTPLLFVYSTQSVGDGMAFSLLLLSGLWLEGQRHERCEAIAGALFGLALAAKFTAVIALPLILALLHTRAASKKTPMQRLSSFAFAAGVALLVACPSLWMDPIRVAKSVLGNAARGGEAMGILAALWELLVAISAPMAVLGIAGLVRLARSRKTAIVVGALVSLSVLVAISANAGVVYDRYFLPGVAVAGLVGLHAPWPRQAGRVDKAFLSVCIVIFGLANGLGYLMTIDDLLDEGDHRNRALRSLDALPDGARIFLPLRDVIERPGLASSESLLRMADGIDRAMLEGASQIALSGKAGLTPDAARILAPAFNEDEVALAARLRAMAGTQSRLGLDVYPWYQDGARFGLHTRDEALAAYRASPDHYLITKRNGACTDYLYLGREGKPVWTSCLYAPPATPQDREVAED